MRKAGPRAGISGSRETGNAREFSPRNCHKSQQFPYSPGAQTLNESEHPSFERRLCRQVSDHGSPARSEEESSSPAGAASP